MNEDFIAFLWQHQYVDHSILKTINGERITVLRPGIRNRNAGPDFVEARIELDNLLWVGTVELHTRTSDWNEHGHSNDDAYGNVILHVVWENDLAPNAHPNTHLPLLELKNLVDATLVDRYLSIRETMSDIPCDSQFHTVTGVEKSSMMDRMLVERLERKAKRVDQLLDRNEGDWNETAWQLIARYFGAKINADAFQNLAERLPLKLLLKHRDSLLHLEALLFGTANLVPTNPQSGYVSDLHREYRFLAKKYRLSNQLQTTEWKLLRLRPAGFPTVRIAQLANLIFRKGNLFSFLLAERKLSELEEGLKSVQSVYWHTHYHFGKAAKSTVPVMGSDAVYMLIINSVVPILAAYGFRMGDRRYVDRAVHLLEAMPAEKNRVVRRWRSLGMQFQSAAATQGATEWYVAYCTKKRCLKCHVGYSLLRTPTKP